MRSITFDVEKCTQCGVFIGAARESSAIAEASQLPPEHSVHGAMMLGRPKYDYPRIPPRNDTKVTQIG